MFFTCTLSPFQFPGLHVAQGHDLHVIRPEVVLPVTVHDFAVSNQPQVNATVGSGMLAFQPQGAGRRDRGQGKSRRGGERLFLKRFYGRFFSCYWAILGWR